MEPLGIYTYHEARWNLIVVFACLLRRTLESVVFSTGPQSAHEAGNPKSPTAISRKEEKKVPPETPEQVTLKLKEQRNYWDSQDC